MGSVTLRRAHTKAHNFDISTAILLNFQAKKLLYFALFDPKDYTRLQNFTFFFVPRGKISNPNRAFNAEFKYVSSFSPSPTVFL